MQLHDSAIARSGDKANRATPSVLALDPMHDPLLERLLTPERVQALGGGVTRSLALDAHGKTLSSAILDLPLDNPGTDHPAAR
jgi:hypothetical protein